MRQGSEVELTEDFYRDLELPTRTIRRGLKELEHEGWILRRIRRPNTTIVTLLSDKWRDDALPDPTMTYEIPDEAAAVAAIHLYNYWSDQWAKRFGTRHVESDAERQAAEKLVRRFWAAGPDAARQHVASGFRFVQIPKLSNMI